MSRLVRRLRRYLPAEAAGEIWREFRPALRNIHTPEAQEVNSVALFRYRALLPDALHVPFAYLVFYMH